MAFVTESVNCNIFPKNPVQDNLNADLYDIGPLNGDIFFREAYLDFTNNFT